MNRKSYLFGYGSLMSPASIDRTLVHRLDPSAVRAAELAGFVRTWTYWDFVVFEGSDEPVPVAFLNVTARDDASCNGTLFEVSDEDLARMDERERHYDRVDVTARVTPRTEGVIYTYVAREGHDVPPPGARVSAAYRALVEGALDHWGPSFARRYSESTEKHSFPYRDGGYRYVSEFAPGGARTGIESDGERENGAPAPS